MNFKQEVSGVCDLIKSMLLEKNQKYGNAALDPVRIFSDAGVDEQLRVRADDKAARLLAADPSDSEDAALDLIGYLVLMYISPGGGQGRMRKLFRVFQAVDRLLEDYCGADRADWLSDCDPAIRITRDDSLRSGVRLSDLVSSIKEAK